jgi:hypothetical protein
MPESELRAAAVEWLQAFETADIAMSKDLRVKRLLKEACRIMQALAPEEHELPDDGCGSVKDGRVP